LIPRQCVIIVTAISKSIVVFALISRSHCCAIVTRESVNRGSRNLSISESDLGMIYEVVLHFLELLLRFVFALLFRLEGGLLHVLLGKVLVVIG
jgi:hypothetical protein